MNEEGRLKLRQRSYLLQANFSASSYIDLLRDIAEAEDCWDLLPSVDALPAEFTLDESSLQALCALIRRGSLARVVTPLHREQSASSAQSADDAVPTSTSDLARQIMSAARETADTCRACEADGKLWPFVDAFALDGALKQAFGGKNPFEHVAEVLRSYFVAPAPLNSLSCPRLFWSHVKSLLSAWSPSKRVEYCDCSLLLKTVDGICGEEILDTETVVFFLGASTAAANAYLAHVPTLEDHPPSLRLFMLLFDIGEPDCSLIERLPYGEVDSIESRLSRLFSADGKTRNVRLPDDFREAVNTIGYVPKVIEVDHLDRLMPRPDDGDDAGEEFYRALIPKLGARIRGLSERWPGTIDSLSGIALLLQTQYNLDLYDDNPTVGLEAAMMSAGLSLASISNDREVARTAFGLKISTLLRADGWRRASDDFVGFLLLLYSFFPAQLSATERRSFGDHFDKHPTALRSAVISLALEQLAADQRYSVNRMWAEQYSAHRSAEQIRLVRSREVASRYELERELAIEVGGEHLWLRLQERTRELLLDAEQRWLENCRQIGKKNEWGVEAGAFFVPIEYELKHWFSFLADEPFRTACVSKNVKIDRGHLTAGPIIVALKNLQALPKEVRSGVEQRGLDAERLAASAKRLGDALYLRNQAFHGDEFGADKIIKMRQALFAGGLLRMYVECLPAPSISGGHHG